MPFCKQKGNGKQGSVGLSLSFTPPLSGAGLPAAADHAGHWAAGHAQVPGEVPASGAVGLGQYLQLSPGLCHLPGGVQRGPGRLQAWLLRSHNTERAGCRHRGAAVGAEALGMFPSAAPGGWDRMGIKGVLPAPWPKQHCTC